MGCGQGFGEDADTGCTQEGAGSLQESLAESGVGEPGRDFACEEGGAFQCDGFGQDEKIAWLGAGGGNRGIGEGLTEHMADDDGAGKMVGDLEVATDELGADFGAGLANLREDLLGQVGGGLSFREEDRGQEPAWARAHHAHVVGVDLHRVPADFFGGEGDGVGGGYQEALSEADDGGVFPKAGTDDYVIVPGRKGAEQTGQQVGGNLAGAQVRRFHGVIKSRSGCIVGPGGQ